MTSWASAIGFADVSGAGIKLGKRGGNVGRSSDLPASAALYSSTALETYSVLPVDSHHVLIHMTKLEVVIRLGTVGLLFRCRRIRGVRWGWGGRACRCCCGLGCCGVLAGCCAKAATETTRRARTSELLRIFMFTKPMVL